MKTLEVCTVLNRLIDASEGAHLAQLEGRSYLFSRHGRYTLNELEEFQRERGIELDGDYLTFLREVGACKLFYAGPEMLAGIEFHRIEEIEERYRDFFESSGPGDFVPVAVDDQRQLIVVMDGGRKTKDAFAGFWIDSHPADWHDTANTLKAWMTFEDYLSHLIAAFGRTQVTK